MLRALGLQDCVFNRRKEEVEAIGRVVEAEVESSEWKSSTGGESFEEVLFESVASEGILDGKLKGSGH